eukprot:scaffold159160_cov58-Attheya_sp.AAC.3
MSISAKFRLGNFEMMWLHPFDVLLLLQYHCQCLFILCIIKESSSFSHQISPNRVSPGLIA